MGWCMGVRLLVVFMAHELDAIQQTVETALPGDIEAREYSCGIRREIRHGLIDIPITMRVHSYIAMHASAFVRASSPTPIYHMCTAACVWMCMEGSVTTYDVIDALCCRSIQNEDARLLLVDITVIIVKICVSE